MITLGLLALITFVLFFVVAILTTIGGVFFITVAGDIIVAIGFIWLLVWLFRKKKGDK